MPPRPPFRPALLALAVGTSLHAAGAAAQESLAPVTVTGQRGDSDGDYPLDARHDLHQDRHAAEGGTGERHRRSPRS